MFNANNEELTAMIVTFNSFKSKNNGKKFFKIGLSFDCREDSDGNVNRTYKEFYVEEKEYQFYSENFSINEIVRVVWGPDTFGSLGIRGLYNAED